MKWREKMRRKKEDEYEDGLERMLERVMSEALEANYAQMRKILKGEIRGALFEEIETLKLLTDNKLRQRMENPLYLEAYNQKVYSQNGEDGIIEEIFHRIGGGGEEDHIFVEFGVQNGLESNGHYLLHKGWKGLWLEGNEKDCREIEKLFQKPISSGQLCVKNAFINKDNINDLIWENLPIQEKEIDLLSIDIDGNDYWVWENISCISSRVVVIEYNAKFPADFFWVMEYDAGHMWDGSDNMGASLKALELLGTEKGYQLVATDIDGANAFFVRKDLAGDKFVLPATSENLYNSAKYQHKYRVGHPSKKYIGR